MKRLLVKSRFVAREMFRPSGSVVVRLLLAVVMIIAFIVSSCSGNDPVPIVAKTITITGISPASGIAGTVVTINGTGFGPAVTDNIVRFNGKVAMVQSVSPTQLITAAPSGVTTGTITVSASGRVVEGPVFTFNGVVVTSVTPSVGWAGDVVVISGSGFSATKSQNAVRFNGVDAEVISSTVVDLTVKVPAGASTGKISVTVNGQTIIGPDFTYQAPVTSHSITAINPTTGQAGTRVTISGTNFGATIAANNVMFNGVAAEIISANATTLIVSAPLSGTTGAVAVVVNSVSVTGPVFTYTTSNATITVLAGGSSGNTNGTGVAAKFNAPAGLAVDSQDNIYVADQLNHLIRKITPSGVVTTAAGFGNSGFMSGPAVIATFNQPTGVAVDASDNIYVADNFNHAIRKISGSMVTTFAGGGTNPGFPELGHVDATGVAARFFSPNGVAIDGAGNILVADTWNNAIRSITPTGVVTTLAGNLSANLFNHPTGLVSDQSNIFVADLQSRSLKLLSGTSVSTVANATGFVSGVAVNSRGERFIVDASTAGVYKVESSGTLTLIASSANGINFVTPTGIAIDSHDALYVSDSQNHRIIKIVLP